MKLYEYVIRVKDQFSDKFQKLSAAAGTSESKVEGVRKKLDETSGSANVLNNTLRSLGRTIATVFAASAIFSFGASIVKAGADMEQTRVSFETMIGSASRAGELIGNIKDMALSTTFDNAELFKSSELLLSFGVSADKIMPTLQALGDVSMGNKQKLASMTLAFAQMSSTGKLMGQDLLQMINAGFNPLQEMSRTTGHSMEYLKDQMARGAISAQMVEEAFRSATGPGGMFYKMLEKQSKTLAGQWATLLGIINNFKIEIGLAIQPALKAMVSFAISVLENRELLKQVASVIGQVTYGVGVLGAAYLAYHGVAKMVVAVQTLQYMWMMRHVIAQTLLSSSTTILAGAAARLNAIWLANPVGVVIAAIVALVGVMVWAYNKFDWFRGGVWGLWEAFKEVFSAIGDVAKNILGGVMDMVVGLFDWDTDKMKAGFGKMTKGLLAANPIGFAATYGKDIASAAVKGFEEGKKKDPLSFGAMFGMGGSTDDLASASGGSGSDEFGAGADLSDGIDSIAGGGGRVMNVTVNVGKFMEKIEIHSTVAEAADEIEAKIREVFVRVINGGIYSATQ